MGVFLPEPNNEWKKGHVFVVKETVHRNFRRVYGSFKLSDGSTNRWTYKRGCYWYDHNDTHPENLAITRNRIKQIIEEAAAPHPLRSLPEDPAVPAVEVIGANGPGVSQEAGEEEDEDA